MSGTRTGGSSWYTLQKQARVPDTGIGGNDWYRNRRECLVEEQTGVLGTGNRWGAWYGNKR